MDGFLHQRWRAALCLESVVSNSTGMCATFFPRRLVSCRDGGEQALPNVRCMERQAPRVRGVRLFLGGLVGLAVGKKYGALAEREESGSQIGSGYPESVGMVTERPVVELCKLTDATLDAGPDGGGPENTVLAELQVAIAPLRQEPADFFIRGAGEEKDVVEVALPGKFGFLLRQARVLHELAGRE